MSSSALDQGLDWDDSDDTRTLLDRDDTNMSTKSASDGSGARHGTAQRRQMALVADALEKSGMGRYQWAIFCLCGFGYTLDLMWAQGFSLIAPRIQIELGNPNTQYGNLFSLFHAGITIEGTLVEIGLLHDLPVAKHVATEPCSTHDWEIIEPHVNYIEESLLSQVRVAAVGQEVARPANSKAERCNCF